MKKTFIIILSVLFSFFAVAQSSSAISGGSLANGKFILNKKKEISMDWKLLTANTVLGKASRTIEGSDNKVHVYDNYGIVLYEGKKYEKPTGIVSEVNIYFYVQESNQLTPNNLFTWNFEIENMKITKESKGEEIGKMLEGKGYKKKGYRSYNKNGVYIILMFSDNGFLQNISIGKSK